MKKLFVLAIITTACCLSCKEDKEISEPNPEIVKSEIFETVNKHRKSLGLNELTQNEVCDELALSHSLNMATGVVELSHEGFLDRFEIANRELGALAAGENVANNFPTGEAVVEAWINSPDHKENLEGNYTHVGIGVAADEDGNLYMTQFLVKI